MKFEDIALIVAAGAVLAVFVQTRRANARSINVTPPPGTLLPGEAGYGWRYYSDGVAIGPDGVYYKNGAAVWYPEGVE